MSNPTSLSTSTDTPPHVQQRRAFDIHARVFALSMVLIFAVNLATNAAAGITGEWRAWWSVVALLGWGLGVAVHGIVVRMARHRSFDAAQ